MTDKQRIALMYKYLMNTSDELQNALQMRRANLFRWRYDEVDLLEEIILITKINFFSDLERDFLNILTDQWIPKGSQADKKRLERWNK